MALINKTQGQKVPIPHEQGQFMIFRPLTWGEVKEAKRLRQEESFALVKAISPDVMERLQGQARPAVDGQIPSDTHDLGTVLKYAIVGWSYSASPTLEEIETLDERTAQWAFRQALALCAVDAALGELSAAASLTRS